MELSEIALKMTEYISKMFSNESKPMGGEAKEKDVEFLLLGS